MWATEDTPLPGLDYAGTTCPWCGRRVGKHREGWLVDHTRNGRMSGKMCRGSGGRF